LCGIVLECEDNDPNESDEVKYIAEDMGRYDERGESETQRHPCQSSEGNADNDDRGNVQPQEYAGPLLLAPPSAPATPFLARFFLQRRSLVLIQSIVVLRPLSGFFWFLGGDSLLDRFLGRRKTQLPLALGTRYDATRQVGLDRK